MSTDHLGTALRTLVDEVEEGVVPPASGDLWAGGRRRRRTARLVPVLAVACVLALVGLLVWPSGQRSASVPAVGVDDSGVVRLTSYPSSIPRPPFIESTDRPGVTAAVVTERADTVQLYAVSPRGAVTRLELPDAPLGTSPQPALSPDGRWLARGYVITDLVAGVTLPSIPVRQELEASRMPAEVAGWWSPDSRRVYVESTNQGEPTSSGLVADTGGSLSEAPLLGGGQVPVIAGWLDDQTVLAFLAMGPGTSRLEGWTWRLGDPEWAVASPDIEWQTDEIEGPVGVGLSPDRSRLLVTTAVTDSETGELDRTAGMLVDRGSGNLLGMPDAAGSLSPAPDGASSGDWAGWGCRPAWQGQRPVQTDGPVRFAPGEFGEDVVTVSSRYGNACVTFAGDELRGEAVSGTADVWKERLWVWGGRALILLAVIGAVRWFTRGRSWRDGSEPLSPTGPHVPQR